VRAYGLAALVLVAAFSATFLLSPWDHELVSDLPLYRAYADHFLDGTLPYGDIAFEYPPLAAPVMALPGLVSLDLDEYRIAFAALSLGLLAALALATAQLARGASSDAYRTKGRPGLALVAVAAAPLATGAMVRTHFDLAPVLCLVAGLAAIAGSRTRSGFALLGIGGALKLFPLVAVPVAAAWLIGRGQRRAAFEGLAVTAGIVAMTVAAAVALSPGGAWDAVEYHLERPVQIESLPATALNALDAAGGRAPSPVHSHQSDGLEHPAADATAAIFLGLLLAALASLTLVARRSTDVRSLALTALGATTAFAAFGKVLSPQFMIWLVPLAALAFAWRMHALAATATAAIAATLAWFPERYFDLVDRDLGPLVAVSVRNALLLATLAVLARELVRASPGAARSTPPARPAALRSAPR
jgi:hypothetical protein